MDENGEKASLDGEWCFHQLWKVLRVPWAFYDTAGTLALTEWNEEPLLDLSRGVTCSDSDFLVLGGVWVFCHCYF